MKYIKLYEDLTNEIQDIFYPIINWDMIEDLKDMSLEYLDNGLELKILIGYCPTRPKLKYNILLAVIKFAHNNYKCMWTPHSIGSLDIDDIKIVGSDIFYAISLIEAGSTVNSVINKRTETLELVGRIEEAYPNEDIKFNC